MHGRRVLSGFCACALFAGGLILLAGGTAGATPAGDENSFRSAFTNASETQIDLTANITLTCTVNPNDAAVRTDGAALVVDGHGFTITQTCPGSGVLENIGASAGALTLTSVTITGGTKVQSSDSVINGGGVYSLAALALNGATVTGNTVSGIGGNGGGVAGGPITINDSTISNNTAEKGGGGVDVTVSGAALVITRSTISGNHTTSSLSGDAGGFGAAAQGTTAITDSSITGNTAASFGGGGFLGVGPNTITRSTFAGNAAATSGGGAQIGGPTTIVNSTFSGNSAGTNGGAFFASDEVALVYVTIAGNTAPTGSGISLDSEFGSFTAFGTVVGSGTGGTSCDGTADTPTAYDVEQGSNTCGFGAGTGDVANGADPLLGVLGANGGIGQTRIPGAGSLLLDAIPVSACAGPGGAIPSVTTDERGVTRPQLAGCDIGAVEVAPAAATAVEVVPRFTG